MLPLEQREEISASQALEEEMFLGLRQLEGVDIDEIERRYRDAAGAARRAAGGAGLAGTRRRAVAAFAGAA